MPDQDTSENPSEQPEHGSEAEPAEPGEDTVVEVALNRAARRGHAKEQQQIVPGHVGPQALRGRSGHAPRSHTKRRSV